MGGMFGLPRPVFTRFCNLFWPPRFKSSPERCLSAGLESGPGGSRKHGPSGGSWNHDGLWTQLLCSFPGLDPFGAVGTRSGPLFRGVGHGAYPGAARSVAGGAARRTATQGLSGLAKLRPDLVHDRKDGDDGFRRNGETVVDMAPAMVRVDDIVLVRAESVPVDGVVLDGLSSLDRSLITGESGTWTSVPATRFGRGVERVRPAQNTDHSVR